MKTAIYPGSFDPITLGHLNIIKRAAVCFDKLIVCVMVNSEKVNRGLFTPEERVELIRRVVAKLPNVEADCSSTLIAEYARQKRACTLVKGLRAVSDYENELQMALINRKLNPRHQHTVTLYAKGLTCKADTLSSCGYVYLAVYPTPEMKN